MDKLGKRTAKTESRDRITNFEQEKESESKAKAMVERRNGKAKTRTVNTTGEIIGGNLLSTGTRSLILHQTQCILSYPTNQLLYGIPFRQISMGPHISANQKAVLRPEVWAKLAPRWNIR